MKTYNSRKEYEEAGFFDKNNCPFCENIEITNKVLYRTELWIIIENKYPYFWDKDHLLALPKNHKSHTYELSKEELVDFINVEKFMKKYYWDKEYFSFIRQTKWNKSVDHLHYHYLHWKISASEGRIEGKKYLRIK